MKGIKREEGKIVKPVPSFFLPWNVVLEESILKAKLFIGVVNPIRHFSSSFALAHLLWASF